MNDLTPTLVRKRSIEVAGVKTSVSLEEEFWTELQAAAASRGLTMEALVADIDANRTHANRSSALRIYALRFAKNQHEVHLTQEE